MRIIAFTDIHGAYKKVEEILTKESSYDVVLIGGDLTSFGSPKEVEDSVRLFQSHGKPLLAVAGNMDPPALEKTFDDLKVSINGKGFLVGDAGFFGVSASPFSPLHTPYEISEEEILRRAEKGWNDILVARWKIFVPHAPPINTRLDRILTGAHVGSAAVREFIELREPDVVVCGHIHEARGKDAIGKTQIVNCGPARKGYYAVIELGGTILIENRG